MNTALTQLMNHAEGRFLNTEEQDAFLSYARGFPERLARARALQRQEEALAETAATALLEGHSDLLEVPHVREKMVRDFKLHLRYVAQAHVCEDMTWFEEQYAEWIAELLTGMIDGPVLVSGYEGLLQAMEEQLEASDFRQVEPFTRRFIELLGEFE